jgi:flagellar biosynthesis protein FlhB
LCFSLYNPGEFVCVERHSSFIQSQWIIAVVFNLLPIDVKTCDVCIHVVYTAMYRLLCKTQNHERKLNHFKTILALKVLFSLQHHISILRQILYSFIVVLLIFIIGWAIFILWLQLPHNLNIQGVLELQLMATRSPWSS